MSTLSLHIPVSLAIRHRRCRPANEVAANEPCAGPDATVEDLGTTAGPEPSPAEASRFQRRLHVPIGLGWLGELDISFSVSLNAGRQDQNAPARTVSAAASPATSPVTESATPPVDAPTPPAAEPPAAVGTP